MARRTDHSREELLELVVDAGTRIIAEEGIGAMTARKVASAIGYSPGSIYNVVENIDALIAHVNTRTMRALNAELDRIGMTGELRTDVQAVVDAMVDFQSRNRRLWTANVTHAARREVSQPEAYLAEVERATIFAEKTIAPAFKEQSEDRARLAVIVLWASLQGIITMSSAAGILNNSPQTTRELAHYLVETFLRGIARDDDR